MALNPPRDELERSIKDLMFKNAVYYANWRVYRGETPASLNYDFISTVYYAFAHVERDGNIILSDDEADLKMTVDGQAGGCLGSLIRLKKKHEHLQVILSIGGGENSKHFAQFATHSVGRENFASSAKKFIEASGLDGIDIDWEHIDSAEQGRDFVSLIAVVRLHLPANKYIVTAALPAVKWSLSHIDLNKAQEYLDYINLMAYDHYGPWTTSSGHHAALFDKHGGRSSISAIEHLSIVGVPKDKIILGIPCYGRSFLGAGAPGQHYSGQGGQDGTFDYKQLPRPGTKEIYDSDKVAAYCVGGDGGFVTYDNPDSVHEKAKYVKLNKLAGLFYWTGTGDVASGSRSLIETGYNCLYSSFGT